MSDLDSADQDDLNPKPATGLKAPAAPKIVGTGNLQAIPGTKKVKAIGLRKRGAVNNTLKKIAATHKASNATKRDTF